MITFKKILMISLVLLAIVLILLVGHYLLYRFFVSTYHIDSVRLRVVLGIFLGFFSIAYFFASFLARLSDNGLTRLFYGISALWLALVWYISMAVILTLFIVLICKLVGIPTQQHVIATSLLAAAFLFTAYGFWNAYSVRVRTIDISIKNLPAEWNGKKIVQLSDIHLGHILGNHFFSKVIAKTNALNPDMVVFTGDLFDGMGGDFQYIVDDLHSVKATHGMFYVKGNHETYMDFSSIEPLLMQSSVRVMKDEIISFYGLQLIGADYPRGNKQLALTSLLENMDASKPSILLLHEPANVDIAKKNGVSLVLSGHTHRGQLFPFEIIAKWVYKQYEFGLVTDGNFSHYTTSGVGTWGPPIRTGNTPEIVQFTLRAK